MFLGSAVCVSPTLEQHKRLQFTSFMCPTDTAELRRMRACMVLRDGSEVVPHSKHSFLASGTCDKIVVLQLAVTVVCGSKDAKGNHSIQDWQGSK